MAVPWKAIEQDSSTALARRGAPAVHLTPISRRRAWAMVITLAALSTCSFLDRNVLALLLPDLKREMGINDVQFGILAGPSFIVVYNVALLFGALVVDRWNRTRLIVIGATIWTTMTILSGFVHSYSQLLALRAGLALGEAVLGPAAVSLIGDLFERTDRPVPAATYITGSVLGSTGSTMISAAVLQLANWLCLVLPTFSTNQAWRLTLVGVGLPGLVATIALLALGREPPRPAVGIEHGGETLLGHLRSHARLYAGIFVGYGMLGMISNAVVIWGPTHLMRVFALSQVRAGYLLGVPVLFCSVAGTLVIPRIFRRMVRQARPDRMVQFAAGAIFCAGALAAVGGNASVLLICVASFSAAMFLAMGVATLSTLVVQLYTPSHLRGRISAALFFTVYLFSIGVMPVIVPLLAHGIFTGDEALGEGLGVVALVVGTISALLVAATRGPMLAAERRIAARREAGNEL